jgi:polyribonucleotide nucleotidyltransferase
VKLVFHELEYSEVRKMILENRKRADGRGPSDIRPVTCEVSILPRTHGSALFTRGETQALAVVTLGTSDDEQRIDALEGEYYRTFMLHYNFPPFSVGEARPLRSPGRREIGHGALAERALKSVLPAKKDFPYTIRLVSDILESNGSSSMATVCGGSLALMDAGVPIKEPVAGIAMGLIKEGEQVLVLSDILGLEDHLGDMDFKVCGTEQGVTALQMDIKIAGITSALMREALAQAREGRLHILGRMRTTLTAPRQQMSPFAPRIYTLKIKPEKIREIIGPGGKVIRDIVATCGVKMDVQDDGTVTIASSDEASAKKAIERVNQITEEVEIGKIYLGKVRKIMDFGAFVEVLPGVDGLVHISQLAYHRVQAVTDEVKEGDEILVKVLEVDRQGKIRLSRKEAMPEPKASQES